jgi:hypothetical protein
MLALGLKDLPSDRVMDDIDKALQNMCGIQSIRYSGKLGHVYYVNDLAAIIAQVQSYILLYKGSFTVYSRKWPIRLYAKISIFSQRTWDHLCRKLGRLEDGLANLTLSLQPQ